MSSASDRIPESVPRTALHVLTRAEDALAQVAIAAQRTHAPHAVQVIDLTRGDPDYEALLDAVFAADSVTVW